LIWSAEKPKGKKLWSLKIIGTKGMMIPSPIISSSTVANNIISGFFFMMPNSDFKPAKVRK
jgi:hypothetical protein